MGVVGDAFNQANDPPGSEKLDLAPFVNAGVVFGSGSGWTARVMALFANFGRLVNKANVTEFSEQSSGTAVRRALMSDFTVMSPLRAPRNVGIAWDVVNTGFVMDAQGQAGDENPLDVASYLFTGASLFFRDPDKNAAIIDVHVGVSELMTGDEVFDFSHRSKPSLRIRPRFWIQFWNGLGKDRPLELGFWGDLGISQNEPDAITAFISMPLRMPLTTIGPEKQARGDRGDEKADSTMAQPGLGRLE
jgi:hypothetical protein